MKEILTANGFVYEKDCMVCKNQYEDWVRTHNGQRIVLKLKKDGKRFKLIANNQVFYGQYGAGGPTPMAVRLETVLKNNGLLLTNA